MSEFTEFQDLETLGDMRGFGNLLEKRSRTKRFPTLYTGDQEVLSDQEVIDLFTNPFIIQEKLQGATRVVRWEVDPDVVLFFCDMLRTRHTIYDKLPSRFILYEGTYYDTRYRLTRSRLEKIADIIGFPIKPNVFVHDGMSEVLINNYLDGTRDVKTSYFTSTDDNGGFVVLSEWNYDLAGKWDRYQGVSSTSTEQNVIIGGEIGRKRQSKLDVITK